MFRAMLTIALLAAALPAFAADTGAAPATEQILTFRLDGALVVGVDGSVVDVELNQRRALGEEAAAGVERTVRAWRFEPVVEDGRPVQARARMRLALEARGDDDTLRMHISDAWFGEEPAPAVAGAPAAKMPPPRYPTRSLDMGVGANVLLLLDLREDGSVARVAAEQVDLLGPSQGAKNARVVDDLVDAATEKAQEWSIPAFAGMKVRVPVRFYPGRDEYWVRTHPVRVQVPTWVTEGRTDIVQLGGGGEAQSPLRLRESPGLAPAAGG